MKRLTLYKVTSIPITSLRHDDSEAYLKEGHGGETVWKWPIYKFFSLYHSGAKERAEELYINWYIDQYHKYSGLEKSKGGMKGGSLDRLNQRYRKSKGIRNDLVMESVVNRVKQRFLLLENIRENGYKPNPQNPVKVHKAGEQMYKLFGGHHRVAILAALQYKRVPDIYVYGGIHRYLYKHGMLSYLRSWIRR